MTIIIEVPTDCHPYCQFHGGARTSLAAEDKVVEGQRLVQQHSLARVVGNHAWHALAGKTRFAKRQLLQRELCVRKLYGPAIKMAGG